MKKIFRILLLNILLLSYNSLSAQSIDDFKVSPNAYESKFVLDSGNLNYLKEDTVINFIYVYDNLLVGEFTEAEYVNRRVTEFNKKEGKGEEWRKGWFKDQTSLYPYEFELLLNRSLKKTKKYFHHSAKAKYALIVKTTYMETGWTATPAIRKPSEIKLEIYLIETANPSQMLAKLHGENIRGIGAIWTTYSTAGSTLGFYLRDNVFISRR